MLFFSFSFLFKTKCSTDLMLYSIVPVTDYPYPYRNTHSYQLKQSICFIFAISF